jgi:hypothetical protein
MEKAERFREETSSNGKISLATGQQHSHEDLYFTKSGNWVKNSYSDYQNSQEQYEIIDEETALVWFLRQNMDLPEFLKGEETKYEI